MQRLSIWPIEKWRMFAREGRGSRKIEDAWAREQKCHPTTSTLQSIMPIYHAATFHNTGIVFNILTIYMAVYMHSWSVSRYLRAVRESRVKGNLQIRCATGRQNTLNEFICSIYVNFEEFRNYFRVTLLRVTHISFRNFFEQLAKYKIRKNLKKSDTIL